MKKNKYDLDSLEKAAARVRAKLGDFDEQWIEKHKDELNKGGFFENPELVNTYFEELEAYLYKRNHQK